MEPRLKGRVGVQARAAATVSPVDTAPSGPILLLEIRLGPSDPDSSESDIDCGNDLRTVARTLAILGLESQDRLPQYFEDDGS